MSVSKKTLLVWQRIVPGKWIDAWLERVAWAGRENCVATAFPSGKRARLQVYGPSARQGSELVRCYGGKLLKTSPSDWIKKSSKPIILPFPPYLCVVSEGKVPPEWRKLPRLLIPAGMAFGTGDHATTAMCLRQILKRGRGKSLGVLDLGTGSGILAIAAAMQGHEVVALDFDPDSIRTAKANHGLNPVKGRIRWIRADVKAWNPKGGSFDLITANLFSALLQEALPRMKSWLKPGSEMVLSGILKQQLKDVLQTVSGLDMEVLQVLKKGKWVCLILRKA